MSITFTHRGGEMDDGSQDGIPALVAELDGPIDDEHPDVSVADDESAWSISAFQGGSMVFENLDDSEVEPRHLPEVSRAEMIRVMRLLARGDLGSVEQLDWHPGYE